MNNKELAKYLLQSYMTQNQALEILKSGHNIYLTGAAGSGKTYLLNEYIRFLKDRGIGVGITASTGIAATHIAGLTIHAWAGIGVKRTASSDEVKTMAADKRVAGRFRRASVLIIEEISMLDADRLDLVEHIARFARGNFEPFGGLQVIFCGDFFQLPPVAKEGETLPRFAYHSTAWKELDLKICYLHEQYRQADRELLEILNAIRSAKISDKTIARLEARRDGSFNHRRITKLYSHNIDVDKENARELSRFVGEETRYAMQSRGVSALVELLKKGCLAPETLAVKPGAVVMFVKNNFEEGYVNGTLGVVSDFNDQGYPVVTTLDGKKFIAVPATWNIEENGRVAAEIKQIPLRLAWAITIHKSQGVTLDAAEIDLSDAFERGMGYVALSRVRSLAGIRLLGFNRMALEVNPEILSFDTELWRQSEQAVSMLSESVEKVNVNEINKKLKSAKAYSVARIRQSHPAAYQKWLSEEEWRLKDGFLKGNTIKTLAGILGRKSGAIRSRLKKSGLIKK